MNENICGVFITEYDSAEKASAVAKAMKGCPHLMVAGATGNIVAMTFIVPESLRWWFEEPAENPELLGAKKVDIIILDRVVFPEKFEPRLPAEKVSKPPCGSDCNRCPLRDKYDCPGCPAIV